MDFSMSALTLCIYFIHYDPLFITLFKNSLFKSYSAIFPCYDVDTGSHSNAPCTFLMVEQVAS